MSKHSKWSKIKRQKGVTDVRRGQMFTKLSRAITIAARDGRDPDMNVRLRMTIDRALAENMPKDNVQRAIDRAAKTDGDAQMESFTLEGFGPGGAALVLDIVTDNRNRAVGDVRRLLADAGGSLGETGTTQWMFERQGHITVDHPEKPDAAELTAIDAGALDTSLEEGTLYVVTAVDATHRVAEAMRKAGYAVTSAEIALSSKTPLVLSGADTARLATLLERLEDHDDIVSVTTNGVPAS